MQSNNASLSGRILVLAAIGVVVVTAVVTGLASGAAGPTLSISDAQIEPGETATTTISLSAIPNGLSGYNLTIRLENDGARITEAAVSDEFGLSEVSVSDDGRSVMIRAVDVQSTIEPGDGSVDLATVTVRGQRGGAVPITMSAVQVDDDEGNRAEPAVDSGTIEVGVPSTDGTQQPSPTDDAGPSQQTACEPANSADASAGLGIGATKGQALSALLMINGVGAVLFIGGLVTVLFRGLG